MKSYLNDTNSKANLIPADIKQRGAITLPEPTSITLGLKEAFISILLLFGINAVGWKLFAGTKLKQLDDHETRLKKIEEQRWEHLNRLGDEVNLKLDHMTERQDEQYSSLNERVDEIYNILLSKKNTRNIV